MDFTIYYNTRRWLVLLLGMAALSGGGCGYVRQLTSPSLRALRPYGVATIPDRDDELSFDDRPMDDDQLAQAFPHLQRYDPGELSFEGRQITDLSVSLLVQLHGVHTLRVGGTGITMAGLKRLRLMPKLANLYVSPDQVDKTHYEELQSSLPGVSISVISRS